MFMEIIISNDYYLKLRLENNNFKISELLKYTSVIWWEGDLKNKSCPVFLVII